MSGNGRWNACGRPPLCQESQSGLILGMEVLNRFESHFLNIADDAVKYCKEVGTGNVKVHLDTFHMIREETSFREAVEACGKEYLGYVHVCENNRGMPGTGLVPWKEFFTAVKKIGYTGPLTIESFDPGFHRAEPPLLHLAEVRRDRRGAGGQGPEEFEEYRGRPGQA